jgi:hypothetical protein
MDHASFTLRSLYFFVALGFMSFWQASTHIRLIKASEVRKEMLLTANYVYIPVFCIQHFGETSGFNHNSPHKDKKM